MKPADGIAVLPGDIVQANPETSKTSKWGPCLIIVTEVKNWGIQGYTSVPMGGDAYIRLRWEDIEPTGGRAEWVAK